MQMITGGNTGIAHITDELPLGYALSFGNNIMGHVHIDGRKAIQVIDADIVTGTASLIGRSGDRSCPGCIDGGALGTGT